jgi:hypothetical protein
MAAIGSKAYNDVIDEPPFGSLQFTVLEVLNAFLDFNSNKGPGRRLLCHQQVTGVLRFS